MHWVKRGRVGRRSQDEERQTRIGNIVLLDFGPAGYSNARAPRLPRKIRRRPSVSQRSGRANQSRRSAGDARTPG